MFGISKAERNGSFCPWASVIVKREFDQQRQAVPGHIQLAAPLVLDQNRHSLIALRPSCICRSLDGLHR